MVKQLSRSNKALLVGIKGTIKCKQKETPSTSPQRAAPIVLPRDPLTVVQAATMKEETYSSSERNRSTIRQVPVQVTLINKPQR